MTNDLGVFRVFEDTPEIIRLWRENMQEPWEDYEQATKFIQKDAAGQIIGGFAVYYDESDGIAGNFVSGWSARKNLSSVIGVIQGIAYMLGEVYIKTNKRQVKIICHKIGKPIKNVGGFSYYRIKK